MFGQLAAPGSLLGRLWKYARWPLLVVFLLYVALAIYRIPAVGEQQRTAEAVAFIQSQRLTMEHVDGKHLPPPPDPAPADATIEGIDANANGIRDDVELAIFKKYPNSPKTRAAELQYAMALQLYLTHVFNSETWVAAAVQSSRGYACISKSYSRDDIERYIQVTNARTEEVESLVLNTKQRKEKYDVAEKNTTSFGLPSSNVCDV